MGAPTAMVMCPCVDGLSHAPDAVGAAGHIDILPNSRNVIPGTAVFTIDFRSPELAVIEDMEKRLEVGAKEICAEMGLEVELEKVGGFDPVKFDDKCVSAIRDAAERLGYSLHQRPWSCAPALMG